ncbi:Abhydro_lipase domain-containing protein [Cephalotus follicularis]|uniref:Abhydro_lipase domain-containing protein n=1 Tax=Cephalotus follicularis TaxID=3775 RepID=A0A1Q3B3P0_CEPFO|nr:Abhydro_lipase domain-containing protein [Cephalotus follicularis]
MQQLRSRGSSLLSTLAVPQLKKKALNSWVAVQDTYFSTKDIFDNHKVVFTVGTSIASVVTAWIGYTIRHHHETKVDQRLQSIEKAMKNNYHLEESDFKKLVNPGSSRIAAWIATAGTTFIIGYGFGWRGGRWYTNRKFRKDQMKLLGQINPRGPQLVTTDDGYILSMQRIPVGRSGNKTGKPPVLLQHGVLVDGVVWLLNPIDQSLPFILADNGYDVWIANSRGTQYSLGHTSLDSGYQAYWNWSWDELAAYDIPAEVEYVHNTTGQKLHYVGHSLGTLIALAPVSQDKLVNMLRSTALLAPIAHMGQIPSLVARIGVDIYLAEDAYLLGIREFSLGGDVVIKFLEGICQLPGIKCTNLMTPYTGSNCCLNSSRTELFLEHEPQATATKNMIHLAQMIRKGTLAMYDYGNVNDNMKHYGLPTPPAYDMTRIPKDFPLFLSHGGQDQLSDVADVKVLLDNLQGHDSDKLMVQYIEEYAHADFVFGVNANQLVYNPIISFFELH